MLDVPGLRSTCQSVARIYGKDVPVTCAAPASMTKSQQVDMVNCVGTVIKGGNTYTSLLNTGLVKAKTAWVTVVFAGTWVNANVMRYFSFVQDEKDILYPVVERRTGFVDATLNGVTLNTKVFKDMGGIPEQPMLQDVTRQVCSSEFELVKLGWWFRATDFGCRFKAVFGLPV